MIEGNWQSHYQKNMLTTGKGDDLVSVVDDANDDSDSEVEKGTKLGGKRLKGSTIMEIDIIGLVTSEYLPIKGIVALSNFRYRVQLNTFKYTRKKFSRNSTDLMEVNNYDNDYDNFLTLFLFSRYME